MKVSANAIGRPKSKPKSVSKMSMNDLIQSKVRKGLHKKGCSMLCKGSDEDLIVCETCWVFCYHPECLKNEFDFEMQKNLNRLENCPNCEAKKNLKKLALFKINRYFQVRHLGRKHLFILNLANQFFRL